MILDLSFFLKFLLRLVNIELKLQEIFRDQWKRDKVFTKIALTSYVVVCFFQTSVAGIDGIYQHNLQRSSVNFYYYRSLQEIVGILHCSNSTKDHSINVQHANDDELCMLRISLLDLLLHFSYKAELQNISSCNVFTTLSLLDELAVGKGNQCVKIDQFVSSVIYVSMRNKFAERTKCDHELIVLSLLSGQLST